MSLSDPIANMLTTIRNAIQVKIENVDISPSKIKLEIIKIMKNEGFIKNFKKISMNGKNIIRVFLKYDDKNIPVIHGIERMSKPGRRVYVDCQNMPTVFNNYGIVIISTSEGVLTGRKAVERRVGGELVCKVW